MVSFSRALRKHFHLTVVVLVCLHFTGAFTQNFDPNIDDKAYLDQIENDIQAEVDQTRQALREQAKYTQDVARNYAGAKIKENLFIVSRNKGQIFATNILKRVISEWIQALRVLVEKEQESIRLAKKELENKQGKQEEEEEEDNESTTTRRPSNFVPVVNTLNE